MRAQARALTPLQLRQEQQSNTDLRCSQGLCAGAGLPDSRTVENLRGTLSIPPEFRLDNVGIGAAHGGKSTIAARQKTVQTYIRPSVGVDHPLAEGVMRWIDGTTERKLRSVLQNPNTNCQALCRARTFGLQNRRDLWKGTGRTAEHEAGGLKHRFLSQHYPRDWGILGGGEIATQVRGLKMSAFRKWSGVSQSRSRDAVQRSLLQAWPRRVPFAGKLVQ